METLHMQDVIRLLGLPAPPAGKNSFNLPCPAVMTSPRAAPEHQPAQGCVPVSPVRFSGGVLDLYAFYAKIPREKVLEELLDRKGQTLYPRQPLPAVEENPLTGVEERHATYTALLQNLTLASDHRENLLSRGLTQEEILQLGIRLPQCWDFPPWQSACGRRACT